LPPYPSPLLAETDDTMGRALAEHRSGNLGAAASLYGALLQREPENAKALHMLGVIALQTGNPAEADRLIARARAIDPSSPFACANHGNALQELGRHAEAIQCYDSAIALDANFAEAFSNRGNALRAIGRPAEALESFDRAIALKPTHARSWSNRGLMLLDVGRVEEAVANVQRALALDPHLAEAHSNLGLALYLSGRYEEALRHFDQALALKPDYPEALSNRGCCLKALERFSEAIDDFTRSLRMKPGYADARYNRGMTHLLLGSFPEGWRDYEYRPSGPHMLLGMPHLPAPVWSGEGLAGNRIIVLAEQGLGDTIQFARYLPLLRPIARDVFFYTRPLLLRLFRTFEGIGIGSEIPGDREFDIAIPLLSLPLAFATTEESIPAVIPYLAPEPDRVAHWRARIGEGGFRIGVCWQGNPASPADRGRSFPARLLLALAKQPGVRLISLQQQNGLEQLADLPSGMTIETLEEAERDGHAFVDTAAIMQSLDLVVTSDTAIAHLAGALGRPVWVALKRVHHWVWLLDREQTRWYPTMRLYRQARHGAWEELLARMAQDLDTLRARRSQ
jgi:tetratricopeptide (TPR) repeat protein